MRPRGLVREAVPAVLWSVALFLLYLVSIGPVSWPEVMLGGCAAVCAACVGQLLARAARPEPGSPGGARPWFTVAHRWPAALLREEWLLLRAVGGRLRHGTRAAAPEDLVERVRTPPGVNVAWTALVLSSTPGACVVGARAGRPGEAGTLDVHRLTGRPSPLEVALTRGGADAGRGEAR